MYGKCANLLDDLGDAPLTDTGIIKTLVGDGMLRCNPKGSEAFSFVPHVVNVWCCNQLPRVDDNNFGDKFDVLHMNNVYGGHDEPDVRLLEKITSSEELSGLYNKAVIAFKGVEERNKFTGSKSSAGRKQEWCHTSNSLARFVDERCKIIPWTPEEEDGIVLKTGFYKAYVAYVNEVGAKIESTQFVKKYLEEHYEVFESRKRLSGENPQFCYVGIEIMSKNELCQESGDLCQVFKKSETDTGGDVVSSVSGISPMLSARENKKKIIPIGSMGKKHRTTDTSSPTDSDSSKIKPDTCVETPDTTRHTPPTDSEPTVSGYDDEFLNLVKSSVYKIGYVRALTEFGAVEVLMEMPKDVGAATELIDRCMQDHQVELKICSIENDKWKFV